MRYVIFFILIWSTELTSELKPQFVVWNVGQGLWTTYIETGLCLHIDMGGEFFPQSNLLRFCKQAKNQVFLSHWDWDHIQNLRLWQKQVPQTCVAAWPKHIAPPKKMAFASQLETCVQPQHLIQELAFPLREKKPNENFASRVYSLAEQVLLPGDSPRAAEKLWLTQSFYPHRILVLSHHGSHTGSSPLTFEKNPFLQLAIASARKKRYGHPHLETILICKKYRVPLLRTEDWGHIFLFLQRPFSP